MYKKKYWKMINGYLSNEYSEKELKEIENLKKNDEEFAQFYKEMTNLLAFKENDLNVKSENEKWEEIKVDLLNPTDNKIYKLNNYNAQQKRHRKKNLYMVILRYAAIFLLAAGLPYLSFQAYTTHFSQKTTEGYRTINVAQSERLAITLSDGTKITLDAGSELKIPDDYDKERNVYLSGEAYFQVVHNKDHPFRVFTNHALVGVIGTEFNVRAWEEIPAVTVTVRKGKVAFSSNSNTSSPKVFLTKGKQSILPIDGSPTIPINVNVDEYTSWMKNELHFKDAPLKEILAQIERWYGYHFVVDDSLLYDNHFTYHIKKTNVDNLIQSISIITHTNVIKEGKTIKLISKKHN